MGPLTIISSSTTIQMLSGLKQQKTLQAKLTDMEGHSRRNNIQIYGLKEGTEGTSMLPFITNFLTTQLDLGEDVDLQIQRAHRSLGPKPRDEAIDPSWLTSRGTTPRRRYWEPHGQRGSLVREKWFIFAHDFPAEVNNKLKDVVKSGFSLNPYSRVFFNEAIEEVDHH